MRLAGSYDETFRFIYFLQTVDNMGTYLDFVEGFVL